MAYVYTSREESLYYKMENLVLTATEVVRIAFRIRFKIETGVYWLDQKPNQKRFANGPGQNAYFKCLHHQKAVMISEPLETWDISLLATVMENFGDEEKYEKENHAVLNLIKIRNELARLTLREIPKVEYEQKIRELKKSLKGLGLTDSDICKFVVDSLEATPLESFKAVLDMLHKADELLQDGKVEEAANCYNEAVIVPNLMPNALSMVLEKRAEFHLSLVKNPILDGSKIDQAFDDVTKALDLNEVSWMGHHLMAKCFKWAHKVPEAVRHYERSLAISPDQKEVIDGFDGCKILFTEFVREGHFISKFMVLSIGEGVDDLKAGLGVKVAECHTINTELEDTNGDSVLRASPGYSEDYVRGIQYLLGNGVLQNFIEAVKCFEKAASSNHPEAMYQLALCQYNGRGTTKNIEGAMRIFKEVAGMDPKTAGTCAPTQMNCNEGVSSAQYEIGLAYETGQGLDLKIQKAVKWFERAMENGSGTAALKLASIHIMDTGVPMDFKMAELYWKEALNFKSTPAALLLAEYYIGSVEPEKATHYFQLARQIGYEPTLLISEEDFVERVHEMTQARQQLKPILETNEGRDKLDTKGLSFSERANRVFPGCFPENITEGILSAESPNVSGGQGSVLARKPYLKAPTRKNAYKLHRESLKELKFAEQFIDQPGAATSSSDPSLVQTLPKKRLLPEPIFVYEMNPREEKLYENRIIHLTVIDEPNYISGGIFVLAEDKNGDVIRLLVCNLENNKKNLAKFSPGCCFYLPNPRMKLTPMTEIHYLRNDEPKCIHHLPKVEEMCRFCGVENAGCFCSNCKRPYCSEECQSLDWNMMNHELICSMEPL